MRIKDILEAKEPYCDACDRVMSKCICDEPVAEDKTLLGSKPKPNPKYLGPTEPVKNISPVLGNTKRKMQSPLNKKFFGGGG